MRPRAASSLLEIKHHTRYPGHTAIARHAPRNGLRLPACSPRRPGFLATVAPEKLASQELDASVGASGPHAFSVRLKRFRQERIRVHRILSRVRDDLEPPLCGTGRQNI